MIYKCKFCNKVFKTESGLNKHCCDTKTRYDNLNPVVFHLYKLYMTIARIKLNKDDEENKMKFVKSKVMYDEFNKFYEFALKVYIPNISDFFKFMSLFNIPIKTWQTMNNYHRFMEWFVQKEADEMAILRSALFLKENKIDLDKLDGNSIFNLLYYGKISKKYLKHNNINVSDKLDSGQIRELGILL